MYPTWRSKSQRSAGVGAAARRTLRGGCLGGRAATDLWPGYWPMPSYAQEIPNKQIDKHIDKQIDSARLTGNFTDSWGVSCFSMFQYDVIVHSEDDPDD